MPGGQAHVTWPGFARRAAGLPCRRAEDDAELDLGLAELSVVGGDDKVAHRSQLSFAAQAEAMTAAIPAS